jgi:hypothetical protein
MATVTADGLPLLDSFLKESMRYNSIDASKAAVMIHSYSKYLYLTSYLPPEGHRPIYLF